MAGSMSKWWPIGIFISALIFFIIGGALFGTYAGSCYYDYYDFDYDYYGYGNSYEVCDPVGEFYGGIACLAIGAVLKLTGWILLIIWCVKRRHTRKFFGMATAQPQHTQPQYAQPQPAFAPSQPTYPPQQPGPYASGMPPAAASSYYNDMSRQAPSTTSSPPPKEPIPTTTKSCGQCGAPVTSPFCPQCGYQN